MSVCVQCLNRGSEECLFCFGGVTNFSGFVPDPDYEERNPDSESDTVPAYDPSSDPPSSLII